MRKLTSHPSLAIVRDIRGVAALPTIRTVRNVDTLLILRRLSSNPSLAAVRSVRRVVTLLTIRTVPSVGTHQTFVG